MRDYILILLILTSGCTGQSPEGEVLMEVRNSQGKLTKQVLTGYVPGQGKFLDIKKYDNNGNLIEEYGAWTDGHKFKTISKYDQNNRLTETSFYRFDKQFENNRPGTELYHLNDTNADYTVSDNELQTRWRFDFNDSTDKRREVHYRAVVDSLTKNKTLEVVLDTIW